jgi:hypothetical protein
LDLFPSYYHMTGQLKEAMHGWRLLSDEVKGVMHKWPRSKLETFFADGISRHLNVYTICIGKRGHNVEKWCTVHLSQIVVHEVMNQFT